MAAKARVWLPEQIKDCPIEVRTVFEGAEAAGISRHALCRIRQELGIGVAWRRGKWWWYGEPHANFFSLKKREEKPATTTTPPTELLLVDFTVPEGFRRMKLPPMAACSS